MSKVLQAFKSCPITRGYKRDLILDLQRNSFDFIPRSMSVFLKYVEGKSETEIFNYINSSVNCSIYKEYMDFLIEKEYVFFCDQKESRNFFKLSNEPYDIPYLLKTIVIEFNLELDYSFFLRQAEKAEVPTLSFDLTQPGHTETTIQQIIQIIKSYTFYTVNFKLAYEISYFISLIKNNLSQYDFNIIIYVPKGYNFPLNYNYEIDFEFRLYSEVLDPTLDFIVNFEFYFESIHFNPFYNKKIYVNKKGEIFTAPDKVYKIDSIKNKDFDFYQFNQKNSTIPWNVPKTDIKICGVCEFRNMCCSAKIVYQKHNVWEYDTPCNYNPYTMEWANK